MRPVRSLAVLACAGRARWASFRGTSELAQPHKPFRGESGGSCARSAPRGVGFGTRATRAVRVQHFISSYGYLAILLLMTAESACIPVPSELTMPFGGAIAAGA